MSPEPLSRLFLSFGKNHFEIDRPLKTILKVCGLPEGYSSKLSQLGKYVGGEFLELVDYIDKHSPPRLNMWDVHGERLNRVQLNPSHRELLLKLMQSGIIRDTYVEDAPYQLHYAMGYLIADPGIFCTLTLTNQTAYALKKYGSEKIQRKFLPHFLSDQPEDIWYGATFYTETQGGSDLGANRAVARKDGQIWRITSKDKYFSSNAGVANGALVTARPEGSPSGAKGLAVFFVPALREDGRANYTIRRLKEKMGTRAVPTGEVEMEDSEAYLIGTLEQGIYIALEVLLLARLANSVAAMGIARKAYLEAYHYCQNRSAFGKHLFAHPLVKKDLLEMEVELEANLMLAFKAAEKFEQIKDGKPPYPKEYHYARFLAYIAKNRTADASAVITQQAMELFGGIGFLEDFPVARWHREALITPIWEGTSNIQALDLLEVITKKNAHELFFAEMNSLLESVKEFPDRKILFDKYVDLQRMLSDLGSMSAESAQFYAKDLLTGLGELAASVYLVDAGMNRLPKKERARLLKIANIYIHRHLKRTRIPLEFLEEADQLQALLELSQ
jgi:acyl-CoA dehydrogenase